MGVRPAPLLLLPADSLPGGDPSGPVGTGSARAPSSANLAPSWPDEDITPNGGGCLAPTEADRQTRH